MQTYNDVLLRWGFNLTEEETSIPKSFIIKGNTPKKKKQRKKALKVIKKRGGFNFANWEVIDPEVYKLDYTRNGYDFDFGLPYPSLKMKSYTTNTQRNAFLLANVLNCIDAYFNKNALQSIEALGDGAYYKKEGIKFSFLLNAPKYLTYEYFLKNTSSLATKNNINLNEAIISKFDGYYRNLETIVKEVVSQELKLPIFEKDASEDKNALYIKIKGLTYANELMLELVYPNYSEKTINEFRFQIPSSFLKTLENEKPLNVKLALHESLPFVSEIISYDYIENVTSEHFEMMQTFTKDKTFEESLELTKNLTK